MDEKTSNNQNYLSRGTTVLRGNLVPDTDNVYDIGTPSRRIRTVFANVEGEISDPDIAVNNIRWPFIGPHDVRVFRPGNPKTLAIDDNTGGDATLSVATVDASLVDSTAVTAQTVSASTTMQLADILLQRTGSGSSPNFSLTSGLNPVNLSTASVSTATANVTGTLTAGSVRTSTIDTGSGNLTLNPAGTDIACSNKAITGVGTLTVSAGSNSAGVVLRLGSTGNAGVPSGSPNCIDLGSGVSSGDGHSVTDQKIRIYSRSDTLDFMGFSVNNAGGFVSSFGGSNSSAYFWSWVATNTERMRLTNGGQLQVVGSVRTPVITTGSGDLSLNPVGSNINCNNKSLINVANMPTVATSADVGFTATNWSGTLSGTAYRVGRQVTVRFFSGVVPNTTTQNVFGPTQTIPAGFRPIATMRGLVVDDTGLVSVVTVTDTGGVTFFTQNGSNYTTSNGINMSSGNGYLTYLTP